jgi:hypothetical protein
MIYFVSFSRAGMQMGNAVIGGYLQFVPVW